MKDLRQTFLPVTAIVALLTVAIAATWTGAQWKVALDQNTLAIRQLSDQIGETWTRKDQNQWAEMLHRLNPALALPPPSETLKR